MTQKDLASAPVSHQPSIFPKRKIFCCRQSASFRCVCHCVEDYEHCNKTIVIKKQAWNGTFMKRRRNVCKFAKAKQSAAAVVVVRCFDDVQKINTFR